MRKIFFLILALLLQVVPATASDVLVVQSLRSPLYDEAVRGFKSRCHLECRTLVLSDYADADVARVVREERPRLLLAVGDGAVEALRKIRKVPVLALMALGISSQQGLPSNITGVDLLVSPDQYLALFEKLNAKRIGIIHDPAKTGRYLKLAQAAARRLGVELVVREVQDPRQAMGQLASLKGKVDALWLLPDTTAVTRETLEAFFLFSQGESIPIVTFATAHLKLGATLAVEVDRAELGKQAAEMASKLLQGAMPADLPVAAPLRVIIKSNEAVVRRLHLPQI